MVYWFWFCSGLFQLRSTRNMRSNADSGFVEIMGQRFYCTRKTYCNRPTLVMHHSGTSV